MIFLIIVQMLYFLYIYVQEGEKNEKHRTSEDAR